VLQAAGRCAREGFDRTASSSAIAGLAPRRQAPLVCCKAHAPPDLERGNANLLGGDLAAASTHGTHAAVPHRFPLLPFRMQSNAYLCSSYAHPGDRPAIQGMCGYNATPGFFALRDIEEVCARWRILRRSQAPCPSVLKR